MKDNDTIQVMHGSECVTEIYTTQNLLRITVVYKHIFVQIFIVMKIAETIQRDNCKNSLQYKNKHFALQ